MTLRRSSRAPPPTHSNSSSSLSSRDRNTRSSNKATSPQKSSSPGSLSSDEADDSGRTLRSEAPTRRRTRAQDMEEEEAAKMNDEHGQGQDGDEVTRCICGNLEYPGPPSDDKDLAIPSDLSAEDVGGLFIQCDECEVWQHGGCVGILEESAVPENYFCEMCRKDLHRLLSSPKGQKYSHYIPVVGAMPSKSSMRKNSLPKEPESKKDKEKPSRASVEASTKRRSTMNSRAAYDEEEAFRKALEESKEDGVGTADSETGTRKGKRSRDESEDVKTGIKRQRTGSGSSTSSEALESDDEEQSKTNSTSQRQKPRGAAAKSHQERMLREQKEREKEREKERAEAAGKRKGRAERRRAEEPSPEHSLEPAEETEQLEAETPATQSRDTPTATTVASSKKAAKGTQKRGNRVGRNQYTRDRDVTSTDRAATSPHRSTVRNNTKDEAESPTGNGVDSAANGSGSDAAVATGKPGKNGKRTGLSRLDKLSWKEMNGTAAHMLEYITRVQMEMASEKTNTTASAVAVVKTLQVINGNGGEKGTPTPADGIDGLPVDGKEENYEGLSSLEMMDVLTRNLVLWQQSFGEHRDK